MFIIFVIEVITFIMNPKITFLTINGVFFITSGLDTDIHGKVITIRGNISYLCWSFDRQLASYLQVTGLRVVTCMRCAFYVEALPFLN